VAIAIIAIIVIAVALAAYGVLTFNGLIRHRNTCEQAFADIDAALKRRHDLIPNLVEAVKGYAAHEHRVFENVAEARAVATGARGPQAQGQAESGLTAALGQLFAVAENYPDLKASRNFIELQSQLSATEDTIQQTRRTYNANVRSLNTRVQSFPSSVVARLASIAEGEFFEVEDGPEREPVPVSFDSRS